MRLYLMLASMTLFPAAACAQDSAPKPASGPILLVGNKGENTVSFVSLATGAELGRSATGTAPHEIAISPDGSQAAVVAYGGRTIDLSPNEGPHGIVWLKDGRLIVTTERSRSLAIVDAASGKLANSIATGQRGHMVAVSSDAARAYTANIPDGTVSVVDLRAGAKLRDLNVGGEPEGIALSVDDRTLWVSDLAGARVTAFDSTSFEKLGEIATGPVPIRVLASPDGKWIVTSNLGNGSLTIIDAASRQRVRDVALSGTEGAGQVTILFGPDGSKIYAAETGRDTVAEVELASGKVLRRLPAGKNGDGLAIAAR